MPKRQTTQKTAYLQASGIVREIKSPDIAPRKLIVNRSSGWRGRRTTPLQPVRLHHDTLLRVSTGQVEIYGVVTSFPVTIDGTMPSTPTKEQIEKALQIVKSLSDVPVDSRALVCRALEKQIVRISSFSPLHSTDQPSPDGTKADVAHLLGRERWVAGKNENPAEFIRRVYADELASKTLTRAHLRRVDLDLYDAYAVWITPKRHPEDDLGLPKVPHPSFESPDDELAHKKALKSFGMRKYRERKRGATLAM